jgi:hypothetical protein
MAPFPKFHTKANEEAEARVDEARVLRERASDVLADIDALLGEPTVRRCVRRRARATAPVA